MAGVPDVTTLLQETTAGRPGSFEQLSALVYDELHALAERHLRGERRDHTLQATELVHEAFLRMVDQTRCRWQDQAHFLAVASRVMRRVLVDHARRRGAAKRGGGGPRLPLEEALVLGAPGADATLLALDLALDKLAALYGDSARIVEMRFFGALTLEECAAVLEVSPRTVSRLWEFAQTWLYREMSAGDPPA